MNRKYNREVLNKINEKLVAYFGEKIRVHGACPQGVDYNGIESQKIRFEQLLKLVDDTSTEFSINDLGCGYGALLEYLISQKKNCKYSGYDISADMINYADSYWSVRQSPISYTFINDSALLPADYTIACGIFNNKGDVEGSVWQAYIIDILDGINQNSCKGFAFNMLTMYSDAEHMKERLYYADPCKMFHYCKQHYSRNVALLHDYKLYDFTLIVRKE